MPLSPTLTPNNASKLSEKSELIAFDSMFTSKRNHSLHMNLLEEETALVLLAEWVLKLEQKGTLIESKVDELDACERFTDF